MQIIDGQPVFSATDLVGFLACEHLTALELAAAARLVRRPVRDDPELDVLQARGLAHEQRYLADLEAAGRKVTRLPAEEGIEDRGARLRRAAAATEAAIRRGDDVVYQATFFDGRWLGYADFLVRVEAPSALGPWSYEIVDTKLARSTKASALLQICSYVDQLTRIQGCEPEWMHVALGGSARTVEAHRVAAARAGCDRRMPLRPARAVPLPCLVPHLEDVAFAAEQHRDAPDLVIRDRRVAAGPRTQVDPVPGGLGGHARAHQDEDRQGTDRVVQHGVLGKRGGS